MVERLLTIDGVLHGRRTRIHLYLAKCMNLFESLCVRIYTTYRRKVPNRQDYYFL
jgi:hypothetical protein